MNVKLPLTQERVFAVLFAFSLWGGALAGLISNWPSPHIVRICVTILNGYVGWLMIQRAPLLVSGDAATLGKAALSFVLAGSIFRLSQNVSTNWNQLSNILFILGTAWTLSSLHFLGKSFAILPAVRGLVTQGPYRWLRHPVYFGELILILACCLAAQSIVAWAIFAVLLPCLILRIQVEENLLSEQLENYPEYQGKVRWRLLFGIW